jgi:hypothetical protein
MCPVSWTSTYAPYGEGETSRMSSPNVAPERSSLPSTLTPLPAKAWNAGERSSGDPRDATTYTIE